MLINELPLKSIKCICLKTVNFSIIHSFGYIFKKNYTLNLWLKWHILLTQNGHELFIKRSHFLYLLSILRTAHWPFCCILWFVLSLIHDWLFFLFQYLFALLRLLDLTRWWGYRPMVVFLLSGHDWSHEFVIFLFILFSLQRRLNSQFLKVFLLSFFSLLFFTFNNISVKGLAILSNGEVFIIKHGDLDWLLAENLLFHPSFRDHFTKLKQIH